MPSLVYLVGFCTGQALSTVLCSVFAWSLLRIIHDKLNALQKRNSVRFRRRGSSAMQSSSAKRTRVLLFECFGLSSSSSSLSSPDFQLRLAAITGLTILINSYLSLSRWIVTVWYQRFRSIPSDRGPGNVIAGLTAIVNTTTLFGLFVLFTERLRSTFGTTTQSHRLPDWFYRAAHSSAFLSFICGLILAGAFLFEKDKIGGIGLILSVAVYSLGAGLCTWLFVSFTLRVARNLRSSSSENDSNNFDSNDRNTDTPNEIIHAGGSHRSSTVNVSSSVIVSSTSMSTRAMTENDALLDAAVRLSVSVGFSLLSSVLSLVLLAWILLSGDTFIDRQNTISVLFQSLYIADQPINLFCLLCTFKAARSYYDFLFSGLHSWLLSKVI